MLIGLRGRSPHDEFGNTMKCQSCNAENRDGRKFCAGCGARLALVCRACAAPNEVGDAYCGECGAALQVATQTPAPRQRAPASYTPRHLADKILQSRSALEGERKQVTVLFADVKGSMELAEQLDPEEWHRILERFFAILTEGVHRFEGTVNQYTGDGIMALFGAPIAHEDHAQRACYAALHLRDALRDFAHGIKRQHGLDFATRIGINSGDVVVGRIGDDLRMDYTAQGHTVGLAQRMEALASGGSIYVTAHTAALVKGYFALEDLGAFTLKGVAEPVHAFELTGIGTARSRFDISRTRGLSRFVGRAADVRTLEDALAQAAAGNGQVIGVVAEAGTGKSRLCFEFLERCRARGMRVFEARAVAHGKNIPLLPILELFRAYFDITSQDDGKTTREKIAGRMLVLDKTFADTVPLVFDFLGVNDPQNPAPQLDPEVRQRQLLGVMRQVIHSASATQPTVALIEDLHWLDAASGDFIEHMVDARSDSRSLLLLNFRPEYHADWMQKSWYRQIPLTPLGREAIGELLTDLLGRDPTIAALTAPIHTRTGGNPFFTEEVVQTLIESGSLEGTRGAYRLVTPIEHLDVPATVQAVLAARIDRLAEREKRLLQVASVIGKDVPEPLLAAVADLPVEELKASLAALRRAEFIHEQAIYPIVEYAFKHPLTQEVALGSQLRERRRHVHVAVARAIEQQDAAHLDERAAILAHHCEEAGEALAAARWHRRAAEWVAATDLGAAAHHWARVRALVRERPKDSEAATLGIAACREVLNLSWRVGSGLDESRALLEEGQALANSIGDRRAHLILAMVYSKAVGAEPDTATYIELARENHRIALQMDDVPMQANACMYLVDALGHAVRTQEALNLAEAGLANFPHNIPRSDWLMGMHPLAVISCWRAVSLSWTGRLRDGFEEHDRNLRILEEDDTLEPEAYVLGCSAEACYHAHDVDKAWACAVRAEHVSRSLGEPPSVAGYAQMAVAFAHLAAGRAADAIEPARATLAMFGRAEKQMVGIGARLLAEALLLSGDLSAAQFEAENAITLCRRTLRGNAEAVSHGILARALLRRDRAAARAPAERALASVAELIERTGATTLAPFLLEWRAELAAVLGDETTRASLLSQAVEGFEIIGAPFQAARLRSETGV